MHLRKQPLPTVSSGNKTMKSGNTNSKNKHIEQSESYGSEIEAMLLEEESLDKGRSNDYPTQQQLPHVIGPINNYDYVDKLTSTILIAQIVQKLNSNEDRHNP